MSRLSKEDEHAIERRISDCLSMDDAVVLLRELRAVRAERDALLKAAKAACRVAREQFMICLGALKKAIQAAEREERP